MAIKHYTTELNDHIRSGRSTVGQILAHSETENFDVSITYSIERERYRKRFSVVLSDGDFRPKITISSDGADDVEIYVNSSDTDEDIFALAAEEATGIFNHFMEVILMNYGFQQE